MFAANHPGRNQPAADASPAQPPQPGLTPQCLKEIEACHARNCRAVGQKTREKKQSNKQLESDQYINILSIVRGDAVNNQYQ